VLGGLASGDTVLLAEPVALLLLSLSPIAHAAAAPLPQTPVPSPSLGHRVGCIGANFTFNSSTTMTATTATTTSSYAGFSPGGTFLSVADSTASPSPRHSPRRQLGAITFGHAALQLPASPASPLLVAAARLLRRRTLLARAPPASVLTASAKLLATTSLHAA